MKTLAMNLRLSYALKRQGLDTGRDQRIPLRPNIVRTHNGEN